MARPAFASLCQPEFLLLVLPVRLVCDGVSDASDLTEDRVGPIRDAQSAMEIPHCILLDGQGLHEAENKHVAGAGWIGIGHLALGFERHFGVA